MSEATAKHTPISSEHNKKRVRFVVVGAGHMGGNHIKKLRELGSKIGARISAIVEPDELRSAALARDFPDTEKPVFLSNLGLLDKLGPGEYPEAAIIAVPASIHVETASACLSKGLHCLVEKPLGFSALDCQELAHMAEQKKKILHVGLLERWSFCHLWRDFQPESGPITLDAHRCGPFVPRVADTDVIHDLMIHDIDLFCVMSSVFSLPEVRELRAWGRRLRSKQLDMATVHLELEDGSIIRFFVSRLSADAQRKWELCGASWHASLDFMRRSMKRFVRAPKSEYFEAFEQQWPGGDALAFEIEAFVRSIRKESLADLLPGTDSMSFCSPQVLLPTPESVTRTHELIDEILSNIKVL